MPISIPSTEMLVSGKTKGNEVFLSVSSPVNKLGMSGLPHLDDLDNM